MKEKEKTAGDAAARSGFQDATFPLGRVLVTPGAVASIPEDVRSAALARHARGDWGDVGPEDWDENDLSLRDGFRLLSAYHTEAGRTFWVITEMDWSATAILLPEEY
jgi:hypothetical protein